MNHVQAFGMANWETGQIIGLICLSSNDSQISTDLANILILIQKKQMSQFQKMTSFPSQFGRWYYLPFNKDIVQLVLATNECNQNNIEMLFDAIDGKIFDHSTNSPQSITNDQKKNISNLLSYFDRTYNKDPKQVQSILETLNNTKSSVQQNIEKLLNNKDSLTTIEMKSMELDDSSKIFLDTATQVQRKMKFAKLKQRLLIAAAILAGASVTCYIIFG